MRITDPGLETAHTGGPPNVNAIMSKIKNVGAATANTDEDQPAKFERATGTPAWEKPAQNVTGTSQSAKLKSMIAGFKKSE